MYHFSLAVLKRYFRCKSIKSSIRLAVKCREANTKTGVQEYVQYVMKQHNEAKKRLIKQGNNLKADERRKLGITISKYSSLVHIVKKIEEKEMELIELSKLPVDNNEMMEVVEEETNRCKKELDELKDDMFINLVPIEDEDNNNVILEVRAGTGGQEACLFAMEVFLMYQKFSLTKNWKFSTMSCSKSESGGFKEASASISGDGVFGFLKYEIGVHRVQRVPATEAMGRLHTSTMTVAMLPEPKEVDVVLNQQDLKIDTFRASGAGGQHVNKTDSAVRITHLPSGIVVSNQDERSQKKNKDRALRMLKAKIFQLQRDIADRERSLTRRGQIGSAERSEKIRTYNFPQNRVTDHRIGVSCKNIDDFLKGGEELQRMITSLQSHFRDMALHDILKEYAKKSL